MHSVVYNSEGTRILVAYTQEQEHPKKKKKQSWKYIVSEIDLRTFDVYPVTSFVAGEKQLFSAQYIQDGIMVMTSDNVTLFGPDGKPSMQLDCKNSAAKYLAKGRNDESFFVFSKHNIYRFLRDESCIMAFDNALHTEMLTRISWKYKTEDY